MEPFSFEVRSKVRQVNLHDMKIHQIIVRLEEMLEISPVSVDRYVPVYSHNTSLIPSYYFVHSSLCN